MNRTAIYCDNHSNLKCALVPVLILSICTPHCFAAVLSDADPHNCIFVAVRNPNGRVLAYPGSSIVWAQRQAAALVLGDSGTAGIARIAEVHLPRGTTAEWLFQLPGGTHAARDLNLVAWDEVGRAAYLRGAYGADKEGNPYYRVHLAPRIPPDGNPATGSRQSQLSLSIETYAPPSGRVWAWDPYRRRMVAVPRPLPSRDLESLKCRWSPAKPLAMVLLVTSRPERRSWIWYSYDALTDAITKVDRLISLGASDVTWSGERGDLVASVPNGLWQLASPDGTARRFVHCPDSWVPADVRWVAQVSGVVVTRDRTEYDSADDFDTAVYDLSTGKRTGSVVPGDDAQWSCDGQYVSWVATVPESEGTRLAGHIALWPGGHEIPLRLPRPSNKRALPDDERISWSPVGHFCAVRRWPDSRASNATQWVIFAAPENVQH
jgi:hypothetical protein